MDKRIGTINPDGTRAMPTVNLHGMFYESSASTMALDDKHFVVLPMNYVDSGLIDDLKQSLGASKSTPLKREE